MLKCRSPPFFAWKQADRKRMEDLKWKKNITFMSMDKRWKSVRRYIRSTGVRKSMKNIWSRWTGKTTCSFFIIRPWWTFLWKHCWWRRWCRKDCGNTDDDWSSQKRYIKVKCRRKGHHRAFVLSGWNRPLGSKAKKYHAPGFA